MVAHAWAVIGSGALPAERVLRWSTLRYKLCLDPGPRYKALTLARTAAPLDVVERSRLPMPAPLVTVPAWLLVPRRMRPRRGPQ